MCGIAGIWTAHADAVDAAETCLGGILTSLAHRGPDDQGMWKDPHARVILGHRRLAVIDLSPQGHQPMIGPDERTAVVFNGEIYNYQDIRRDLEREGFTFRSESDTEVLLKGYMRWGEGVLERLVGMFAFAIWDAVRKQLFIARDRAGEKPLYYAMGPWGFAFASEIAGLATVPDVDLSIDQDALALYLEYQYVPAPHTIYRGIHKLAPAHALLVTQRSCRTWRYWDPVPIAAGARLEIPEPDALEELERLLRIAVQGQMIADVPLGAFLSGGIDSTAVVSLMTELSPRQVRTFTIGFDVEDFDESTHATAVAEHLGTDHTVEWLTERDALDLVPQVPAMYGEPFSDSSALPTHLVSRVARKHVTVSLSGDGGDEAFGGYRRYGELERIESVSRLTWPLTGVVRSCLSRVPGRVGRGAQLLGLPTHRIYRGRVGVFGPADVWRMTGRAPSLPEYDRAWSAAAARPLRQRAMLADFLTYLPEAILVKVDRAAMKVSLETRAPFLDHRLLEFALRLPVAFVREKALLKRLVYRRVPRSLVDRPKQGFGVPLGNWFRAELRELLVDALTPPRMAAVGIQDFGVVQRLLSAHFSGSANEQARLWSLLVLSLWHEEQRSTAGAPMPLASAV